MSTQEEARREIVRTKFDFPNMSGAQIAKMLGKSERTVQQVLKTFWDRLTTQRKKGSGGKSGFNNKILARKIVTSLSRNPMQSGRDLAKKFKCSETFVRKVRKFYKLKSFRKQKVPHRTEKQNITARKRARIFYDQILTKNAGCILEDDETYLKFNFKQLPGRSYYVSKIRGKVNPRFKYIQCDKFGKKAMIWQAICSCGLRSSSYCTKNTMKTENYLNECLKKRLLPLIRKHNGPVLFWPDLASCHYSKPVLSWMEAEGINFVKKTMNPPNCPELRGIERFWAIVKRRLLKNGASMTSIEKLKKRWDLEVKKAGPELVRRVMGGINGKFRKFIRTRE